MSYYVYIYDSFSARADTRWQANAKKDYRNSDKRHKVYILFIVEQSD
jgi:hypothetical protein